MSPNHPIFKSAISYESDLPLHFQILSKIKHCLATGELKPGDMLPPEEEMSAVYNVSRSTVRQAMGALVDEGVLVRVRGKGTFVSEEKMRRRTERVYSFSREMEAAGRKPSSRVISVEQTEPTPYLRGIFALKEGEKVWRFVRLRMADGEPMLLETTFIPVRFLPRFDGKMEESASLYDMLSAAGIRPDHAEETYESIIIEKSIREQLGCARTAGFFIERKAVSTAGDVYEVTQSVMRGDRSKVVVTLRQEACSFNRTYE